MKRVQLFLLMAIAALVVGCHDDRGELVTPQIGTERISFTYSCSNQTVTFTNTSTDGLANFYWYFGDGEESHSLNAVHHYAAPGKYSVKLTGTAKNGYYQTTQTITVQ